MYVRILFSAVSELLTFYKNIAFLKLTYIRAYNVLFLWVLHGGYMDGVVMTAKVSCSRNHHVISSHFIFINEKFF